VFRGGGGGWCGGGGWFVVCGWCFFFGGVLGGCFCGGSFFSFSLVLLGGFFPCLVFCFFGGLWFLLGLWGGWGGVFGLWGEVLGRARVMLTFGKL